ncbi:MAG: aminotransferase class IV [Bacteroidia bacterium]|nr:aminotransferase class IV [Bacteroidia bacterium]
MLIVNGKVIEEGSSDSSLLNRAFKFGDAIFIEMRVYRRKVLFLEAQLSLLMDGMKALKLEFHPEDWEKKIKKSINKSLEINGIKDNGRLRLQVFRAGTGAFAPLSHKPSFLLEAYALKDNYFESKVFTSLIDYKEMSLAPGSLSRFNSGNSLTFTLASIHAQAAGFEAALLYGPKGIAMASNGNLFLVKQKKLISPPLDSACTDSVMRSKLIQLAKGLKVPFSEKNLSPKDLMKADEIFVCNDLRGILPVSQYREFDLQPKTYVLTPFLKQCLQQYIDELF